MDHDPHHPRDRDDLDGPDDLDDLDGLDDLDASAAVVDAVVAALRDVEPPAPDVVEAQIAAALEAWDDLAVPTRHVTAVEQGEVVAGRRRRSRSTRWSFAGRPAWIGAAAAVVLVVAAATVVVDLGSSPGSDDDLATPLGRSFDIVDEADADETHRADQAGGDDSDASDRSATVMQPMAEPESMDDADESVEMFALDGANPPDGVSDADDTASGDDAVAEPTTDVVWLGRLDVDELDRVLDELATDPDSELVGIADPDPVGAPFGAPIAGAPCTDSLLVVATALIDGPEAPVVIGVDVDGDEVVALDLDTCDPIATRALVLADRP